jgi:hypothetical protein
MVNYGNILLVIDYDDKELPANQTRQTVYDWLVKEVEGIAEQRPYVSSATYGKFTKVLLSLIQIL